MKRKRINNICNNMVGITTRQTCGKLAANSLSDVNGDQSLKRHARGAIARCNQGLLEVLYQVGDAAGSVAPHHVIQFTMLIFDRLIYDSIRNKGQILLNSAEMSLILSFATSECNLKLVPYHVARVILCSILLSSESLVECFPGIDR